MFLRTFSKFSPELIMLINHPILLSLFSESSSTDLVPTPPTWPVLVLAECVLPVHAAVGPHVPDILPHVSRGDLGTSSCPRIWLFATCRAATGCKGRSCRAATVRHAAVTLHSLEAARGSKTTEFTFPWLLVTISYPVLGIYHTSRWKARVSMKHLGIGMTGVTGLSCSALAAQVRIRAVSKHFCLVQQSWK